MRALCLGAEPKWRNWETRWTQNPVGLCPVRVRSPPSASTSPGNPWLNIAIFGLDNLIYLMYPYRQSEEGLQPFVRATLTFTAKGLLFAIALAIVYLWAVSCRRLSQFALFSLFGDHRMLFAAGLWMMMVTAAVLLTLCSARQFARFDPTSDQFA